MKISVIIPVYNAEAYLNKCLESVVKQSYKEWEVIAIDDGSVDNSYSILKNYASSDERFQISTQPNIGPGPTRNRAIKQSTGNYIVFLDSDDYFEKDYFEEIVNCVSKKKSDVIFIDMIQEKPNGDFIKYETLSKYKNFSKDTIIRYQMVGKLPWGGVRKVVKASLIKQNNIRYSDDEVGEEALYSFRVLYNANVISFIEKICYHHVIQSNSQSKKGNDDPWGNVSMKMKKYHIEHGLYEKFETAINSFGYTAMIISIYRIANNYKIKEAVNKSRIVLGKFKSNFDFYLDKNILEPRTRWLYFFAKSNLVLPIILIAKIKKSISKSV